VVLAKRPLVGWACASCGTHINQVNPQPWPGDYNNQGKLPLRNEPHYKFGGTSNTKSIQKLQQAHFGKIPYASNIDSDI